LREYNDAKVQEGNDIVQKFPKVASSSKGMAILSEITMDEIFLFTTRSFLFGQSIALQFDISKKFVIYAEVINCFIYNMHRKIVASYDFKYRLRAKFLFNHYGDRSILREFISALAGGPIILPDNVIKMEKN
jgi:hypothetical protein